MYRIIDSRGSGKTSRLMLLAKENNGILVCSNPGAMREKSKAYGLIGFDIISYKDFLNCNLPTNNGGYPPKPIYIDEIENFLVFINMHVQGYTLTNED